MADKIGILLSGLLILAVYSYLFRDSRAYSYVEHIYVGFVAAQAIVLGWQNIRDGALRPLQKGQWTFLIPVALGLLMYARFWKRIGYLTRLPVAFMMGVAAGVTITGAIVAQFVTQVRATMLPLVNVNNVIIVVGTACTLSFFLFIPLGKHLGNGSGAGRFSPMNVMSNIGRATMMAAFGSSYGFIVMSRLSYLVARLQFLLGTWTQALTR
ncbi:MAG: hypothetical protein WD024_06285 [Bacillota bacterium]